MQRPSTDGFGWDDLRTVLAIARAGSLAGAARQLGVNHSTVFRRLGALETALGTRLCERAAFQEHVMFPYGSEPAEWYLLERDGAAPSA